MKTITDLYAPGVSAVTLQEETTANSFREEQYDIVSTVSYLIGVRKPIFEGPRESCNLEIYNKLDQDKRARIIRNLCILRTQLEHNFLKICHEIQYAGNSILNMPQYMPLEAMQQLSEDGIKIYTNLKAPTQFLINLNLNIKDHINNCRELFPEWIKWEYLAEIFIMPDGLTEEGQKKAAAFFYANMNYYPYKQYMNWPAKDNGNILLHDRKFVTLLYSWHNDKLQNNSLVSDVCENTKENIYTFIENSNKCVFIVDCENSDPYRLCAALNNLEAERLTKIDKIILFDDINAASAWEILESHVDIPVEYIAIERLKEDKSLTDVKVTARACKEFYANNVDSFVLVSSDSDYWGLIEELPDAKYMIMLEHEKTSFALKETLRNNDIFYCYIDSFYSGSSEEIKKEALHKEFSKTLKEAVNLNLYTLMREVLEKTRIRMTGDEVIDFIKRKVKNQIEIEVMENGEMNLSYRLNHLSLNVMSLS